MINCTIMKFRDYEGYDAYSQKEKDENRFIIIFSNGDEYPFDNFGELDELLDAEIFLNGISDLAEFKLNREV